MSKLALLGAAVAAAMMLILPGAPAQAQATRTWVSGVGDDVNPCSRTAPCKTWAGAISKTAAGGEIDALDPGGFGAVTITKSITLDGGGGQVASTLVAGTNGIVVAAASNDVVIIRNIRFQGVLGNGGNPANAGVSAIKMINPLRLVVDHCFIMGFNTAGIWIVPGASGGQAMITDTQINNSTTGILIDGTNGSVNVTIENSVVAQNTGDGILIQSNGQSAGATIDNTTVSHNAGVGVQLNGSNSAAVMGRTQISTNSGGGVKTSGPFGTGTFLTFKNNQIDGNNPDVSGTLTLYPGGLQ